MPQEQQQWSSKNWKMLFNNWRTYFSSFEKLKRENFLIELCFEEMFVVKIKC